MEEKIHDVIGKINLGQLVDIDIFLQIINKYSGDYTLLHNGYVANAKSLLGIVTLDLTNDLVLVGDNLQDISEIEKLTNELRIHKLLKE